MSRILVIDDDPGNRLIVKSRLGDQGYDVALAETGAEGLVEARRDSVDLVLVTGPLGSGIDAIEVCRRLKSMPETSVVPVLIYNQNPASTEEMGRAYDSGCDAYVAKPSMPVLDHVVRVLLRSRSSHAELLDQNQVLERQNRALVEQAQCQSDREASQRPGDQSLALRHLAAGRPDGLMLVDGEGFVRRADRGACEFFGNRIEGKNLGSLAPASGLEAFVRDARSESREGFRFDLSAISGRSARSLTAAVVPLVTTPGETARGLKVVLLLDVGRRRIAAEMLRSSEPGIPRQQLGALLDAAHEVYHRSALVGDSEAMQHARRLVLEFGKHPRPVLIEGSKGVGKLRLARTLHYSGPFSGAFLQLRCSAFDEAGLAHELFGTAKDAEGDGSAARPGLLHKACDGTVYLEELGALPKAIQKRLLAFLRSGEFTREGGGAKERVEVHLVASTSEDLAAKVSSGAFDKDLYALFAECRAALPPLADRTEDVLPLAMHYVSRFGPANGVHEITDEALQLFLQYEWPANVAELIDVVREACRSAEDGTITPATMPQPLRDLAEDLPAHDLIPQSPRDTSPNGTHRIGAPTDVQPGALAGRRRHEWDITEEDPISLDHYEMKALMRALEHVGGDKLAAARLLKVGKSTLYRKLKRFGIQ